MRPGQNGRNSPENFSNSNLGQYQKKDCFWHISNIWTREKTSRNYFRTSIVLSQTCDAFISNSQCRHCGSCIQGGSYPLPLYMYQGRHVVVLHQHRESDPSAGCLWSPTALCAGICIVATIRHHQYQIKGISSCSLELTRLTTSFSAAFLRCLISLTVRKTLTWPS